MVPRTPGCGWESYAVRVGDCNGFAQVSGVLSALDWLANYRTLPAVANLSYSWPARSDIDDAVQRVVNAGVTFAVSAGNDDRDACEWSPGRTSGVLTVGNSGQNDWRASSSNWGSCVDLFAPGEEVKSAWSDGDASYYYA